MLRKALEQLRECNISCHTIYKAENEWYRELFCSFLNCFCGLQGQKILDGIIKIDGQVIRFVHRDDYFCIRQRVLRRKQEIFKVQLQFSIMKIELRVCLQLGMGMENTMKNGRKQKRNIQPWEQDKSYQSDFDRVLFEYRSNIMIKFRQTSTAFANRKTAPQPIAGHRTAILFVLNFSKTVFQLW